MKWLVALALMFCVAGAANAFDYKKVQYNPTPPDPIFRNPILYAIENPTEAGVVTAASYYTIGVPFCGATTLILAVAIKRRELKRSEATAIVASCFLPIIGGLLVHRAFSQHPEWERYTQEERESPSRDRLGISSQR